MLRLSRFVATFLLLAAVLAPAQAGKPYQHYVVGDAANVVLPQPAKAAMVLMGGGPDVDAAFAWMIQKGGGGNFVVLRSRGTDAYNPYIYAMGGVQSVETLVIPSRSAASDPFVIERIRGAEALFIAGGDQADYVNYWQGTPVQAAIQELAGRKVPIGGTSAGMMLLGRFGFAALNGSITSDDALANPYDKRMTLVRDYLSLPDMGSVVTDAHFDTRARLGRLVAFMARIVNDGWAGMARGIGVDVETALLVEDGMATRTGLGSVTFLQSVGLPQVCAPRRPLTYLNLEAQRMSGGGSFDLRNWAGYGGATVRYTVSADKGVLLTR
ncbi:MAG: Cyanophycinase and related exopeptidase-like protein [Pseudoduganella sp.]|jgi:cyanophycinase-like exopeptidase|nr:Cyanophycinase and related exopeptidase-like protein [Pseudoduganella sp.]